MCTAIRLSQAEEAFASIFADVAGWPVMKSHFRHAAL
jgi:hypothetical protein